MGSTEGRGALDSHIGSFSVESNLVSTYMLCLASVNDAQLITIFYASPKLSTFRATTAISADDLQEPMSLSRNSRPCITNI